MYGFDYVVDAQPPHVKKNNRQQHYIRRAKLFNYSL